MGIRSYVTGMSLMLLIASLLLGGLFYLQWHEDLSQRYLLPVKAVETVAVESEAQSFPPFMPVSIQSLAEITERPLFTEGRTPPEKPTKNKQGKRGAKPLRLKLEGVAITPESKVAIITDLQTNELLRLSQGMSHGDWKVTGVSEESVTIQQGGRETTLILEIDESQGTSGSRPKIPFRIQAPRKPARQK